MTVADGFPQAAGVSAFINPRTVGGLGNAMGAIHEKQYAHGNRYEAALNRHRSERFATVRALGSSSRTDVKWTVAMFPKHLILLKSVLQVRLSALAEPVFCRYLLTRRSYQESVLKTSVQKVLLIGFFSAKLKGCLCLNSPE